MSKGFYFEKKAKRELDKIISELLISDRDVSREELSGFCPERLEIAKVSNPETKNQRKFNVKTLGEEADLEAQTFSLAQTPIGSTNVQFSINPAFLPNVCYALVVDF